MCKGPVEAGSQHIGALRAVPFPVSVGNLGLRKELWGRSCDAVSGREWGGTVQWAVWMPGWLDFMDFGRMERQLLTGGPRKSVWKMRAWRLAKVSLAEGSASGRAGGGKEGVRYEGFGDWL